MGVVLELGILGPFEVRIGGGAPASLGGLRQRALLAVLGLHANEVVSTDRLVDQLWSENAPATAVHTVQVFVSRLRGALGDAGTRLVTRPPGYVLELGVDELDAARCERLYDAARSALNAGDAPGAASLLQEAEALWRGPPLAEFTYEPFAQASIARLEELRLSCREELIEAHLGLGRHAEVISVLEALVREQPFRERPRGQLMLALYRCGRQAEALEEYQRARHILVEELAVEPSAALRELEQAILRQDDSLRPPTGDQAAAGPVGALSLEEPEQPAQPPEPAAAVRGPVEPMVRKTATVLVGRFSTSGSADPEAARGAMAAAREQAEQIVSEHGGAFVGALGGELVWVFGVPLVKEDDALRALRAAHLLRTTLRSLAEAAPCRLVVRLGLATGEVVAEAPGDVFGDPLNHGLSLAQTADEGEVLLSDTTRRLASGIVRVEPTRDSVSWRLLDLVRDAAPVVDSETPMVGRDGELALALAAFERAARAGETHLLTVVGDPGIGKSRFAQELARRMSGQATILLGHCLSYGEGIAFWPLREALLHAAGAESRDALRSLLGNADDADVVADTIAMTLGLIPAESISDQVPWAFRRLLEVVAAERPLMVVIEDAHWADAALLDLIDYLVDWLRAPALVVCLARPEIFDARPAWGGGRPRVSSLLLGPLPEADAHILLTHQLGDRQLSATESARILETAEGNPLFVEQLLQTSAEDPRWFEAEQIPGTVQSLLAARIDRLGPGERAFIERAAVIGREFWPSAVVELLPPEARASVTQHLRSLVHRGFLLPDRSVLAGEEQLRFSHILVRDVAYRSTPKSLRADLHERFAGWLERHDGTYDEFIGYHLEQSFRYRTELALADAEVFTIAARAGERFAAAGRRAISRGDANSAVTLLRNAWEMFQAGDVARSDVLIDLGSALGESGEFDAAAAVLHQALDQAVATNSDALRAHALIELSYLDSHIDPEGGVRKMQAVAEDAIAVFDRLGDDGGLSRAWLHVALAHWIRSDSVSMGSALERALKHADRAGEPRDRSRILIDLARTTVIGPLPVSDGIRRNHEILTRADGDISATAFAEAMLAVLEAMDGRFPAARERWQRSKRRLIDVGLQLTVAVIQMYYAFIELLAATPEKAEGELAEACATFEELGARGHLSSAAALAARLVCDRGRTDDYERYRRLSLETTSDDDVVSQVLLRGTHARVLANRGDASGAGQLANSAVALAEATDFLMLTGDALRDRAEVLTLIGRPAEAAHDLRQAGQLYRRKGIRAGRTEAPAAIRPARADRIRS